MMEGFRLDTAVDAATRAAAHYARELGSESVGTEHLLLGFLRTSPELFRQLSNAELRELLLDRVTRGAPSAATELPFTAGAVRALQLPLPGAARAAPVVIRAEHVIAAMLDEPDGLAGAVLRSAGITSLEDLRW